jgi:uncharacterized protein YbjT (DUF2867 family)
MSQPKLVLVTGATGKQGGAVVEALLIRGHQVRALTRNSASSAANRLREQGLRSLSVTSPTMIPWCALHAVPCLNNPLMSRYSHV